MVMPASPPDGRVDGALDRVDQQIAWYDHKSRYAQRMFKTLKIIQISAAAAIPVLTTVGASSWVAGACGAMIVALEGVQQLNQYHSLWINYRATAESLKHEKYLWLASANPYAGLDQVARTALLAERAESLISQEDTKWTRLQQTEVKGTAEKGAE